MGSSNVRIAQVNTVDLNEVMDRQAELEAAMEDEMKANGYDLFVLVVTNILDSDSELLVAGKGKKSRRSFPNNFDQQPCFA